MVGDRGKQAGKGRRTTRLRGRCSVRSAPHWCANCSTMLYIRCVRFGFSAWTGFAAGSAAGGKCRRDGEGSGVSVRKKDHCRGRAFDIHARL